LSLILPQRGRIRQAAAGGGALSVSYLGQDNYSGTSETSHTISAASLGADDANRKILVSFAGNNSSASAAITDVTVDGVSGSAIAGTSLHTDLATVNHYVSMWEVDYPSGTSKDIVITFSDVGFYRGGFVWYRIVNGTAVDGGGANVFGDPSISLDIATDDIAICHAYMYTNTSGSFSAPASGWTVDLNNQVFATQFAHEAAQTSTTGTPTTITFDVPIGTRTGLTGCVYR